MKAIQSIFTSSNARRVSSKNRALAAVVLLGLSLGCGVMTSFAADSNPPKGMTYQGYLTDVGGTPLGNANPANYDIIFRIYDASTAGNLKWSEKQTVTIDKGQFSVVLGEGAANGSDPHDPINTVFSATDASDRYIGITVKISNTDVDIAPRLRLVTSPYSFLAKSATAVIGADGGTLLASTAPGVVTVNGQLNATGFNGSGAGLTGITAGQVPNLDASKITTGTLADARLSGNVAFLSGGKLSDGVLPTTQSGKTFNTQVSLTGANVIEFGAGTTKEVNDGKIGYKTFSNGLDIVGAGTASDATDRRITLYAYAGTQVNGTMQISPSTIPSAVPLNVHGWGAVSLTSSPDGFANNSGFNGCCGLGSSAGGSFPITILADQWFGGAGFVANSDRRIKDVVGLSDTHNDLDTIMKVRVTDYRMIDNVREGDAIHKGVIAQEIRSVIPEAVSTRRNMVPDVYSKAKSFVYDDKSKTITITLPKEYSIATGEVVSIYVDNLTTPFDLTVLSTPTKDSFKAELATEPKAVFVYGHQVDDFLAVNYDRIFTTGIGAIQELHKIVKAQEARISTLEEKASKVDALEMELSALKKQLAASQESSERTEARFQALDALVKKLASGQGSSGVVVAGKAIR